MTPSRQLSRRGLWLAGRRAGVAVVLVAAVLAAGVLRLKAREVGYVAGFAGVAVVLYFARGYIARSPGRTSDVRWWGAYVLGFLAFAYLRTLADETGTPGGTAT
ncbi:MAG: hypothetical protein QF664_10575 [Dehalococcoidia bacterium]|jgi:uncharacterized membrane protein|nr:hypothetical protein [Dehalococcoidia bacterium]